MSFIWEFMTGVQCLVSSRIIPLFTYCYNLQPHKMETNISAGENDNWIRISTYNPDSIC